MNCREVRRWFSPYLDSELGKTKTFEVSEHLRECSVCAKRFEQERRVDTLIAEKLSDTPRMNLATFARAAARPKRSVFRSWPVGAFGLAACLALFSWFAAAPLSARSSGVEDWIAGAYVSATPDAAAFVAAGDPSLDVLGMVASTLGVQLSMKPLAEALPGHMVELVSVERREREGGASFVEVRLNCCGEPVLLAFTSRAEVDKLGPLPTGAETGLVRRHGSTGVNVATWGTRDLVLVGASRHSLDNITHVFSVQAT